MRIACEKCSAAYAIDDKFVTPKGVRAQCPRCRHLQTVKKGEPQSSEIAEISSADARAAVAAAAAAASKDSPATVAAAAPSAFLFDLGAPAPLPMATRQPDVPPPPPLKAGGEMDFGDFDLGDEPVSSGSLLEQAPVDFSGLDPLDAEPTQAFSMPPPALAAGGVLVKCRTCGKPLTDPFDQAIGICDDCRDKVDSASAPPPAHAVVLARLVAPKVTAAAAPLIAASMPVGAVPRRSSAAAVHSGDEEEERSANSKRALAVVGLLLVLGVGAVLVIKKPWQRKPPPLAARISPGAAKPIERAVETWARRLGKLTGSSADHLAAGEEKLENDTGSAYLEAEVEFQKALVLDKSNDRAIAGWVLAMAFGRGSAIDDETAKIAEELLVSAEQRGGAGRIYTAHAHLLLARNGNLNDIKIMAERGKNSPSDRDQALALLALGQSMLTKNPTYASESFSQALKLDPKLKRAYLAQSQLLLALGRYREAVANIEKRLELDPNQWEAADALARTWIEVGEVAKGKKVYEAAYAADGKNFRARLALAILTYQHENNWGEATAQLNAIIADGQKISVNERVEALGHLAAVQRLAGEPDAAIASAEKGIALKAKDPHVNLQRFLVALEQRNEGEARAQWPFIAKKLGDTALEGTLEGGLLLLEGDATEAMRLFAAANASDPRRIDALLLAGASAAKASNEGKAWEYVLKLGLKGDPRYAGPLPVMARFYVRPMDLLRQARGLFEPLKVEFDDPNVPTAEGIIAWYSNDFTAAEKHFARAVAADPGSGHGFAFRSLLALRRKENGKALKLAQKAVAAERELALAHYALGMALLATNQFEVAKAPFRTAFELEPKFAATQVKLAEIEMMQKKPDEARRILGGVLLVDPLYFDAKKALYLLP